MRTSTDKPKTVSIRDWTFDALVKLEQLARAVLPLHVVLQMMSRAVDKGHPHALALLAGRRTVELGRLLRHLGRHELVLCSGHDEHLFAAGAVVADLAEDARGPGKGLHHAERPEVALVAVHAALEGDHGREGESVAEECALGELRVGEW